MESKNKQVPKRERTPEKPDEDARLSTEAVRVISQSVPNLPLLSDAAAATLASDAEYRLRQIIQEGVKFMKHSNLPYLLPTHINIALRVLNVQPVYGFATKRRKSATPSMFDPAARDALVNPAGPSAGVALPDSDYGQFSQVEGIPDLFFVDDSEVSIKSLLHVPPPELPLEVTVNAHWLAVDGSQPAISQNPVKRSRNLLPENRNAQTQAADSDNALVDVIPPLKHDLTRELQLYFEHVTEAILGKDVSQLEACLESVSHDKGIAILLPYLTKFIKDTVHDSIRDLSTLFSVMRLVKAILENDVFSELERYLHQLLPAVMSCVVGKRLCSNPRDNHWALRDYTARLIQRICSTKYTKGYVKVQQRITKTFIEALKDVKRPLTTHYGAIVGVACLGKHSIDVMIVPLLRGYMPKIKRLLEDPSQRQMRRHSAAKVFGALTWSVSGAELPSEVSSSSPGKVQHVNAGAEISVSRLSKLVPDVESLHDTLKREMGQKLYPFGDAKSDSELAASIVNGKSDAK